MSQEVARHALQLNVALDLRGIHVWNCDSNVAEHEQEAGKWIILTLLARDIDRAGCRWLERSAASSALSASISVKESLIFGLEVRPVSPIGIGLMMSPKSV